MKKLLIGLMFVQASYSIAAIDYTQKDRDILIEVRTKIHAIDKHFDSLDRRFDAIDKRFDDLKWFMTTIIAIATAMLSGLIIWVKRQGDQIQEVKSKQFDLRDLVSALYVADSETKRKFREALKA